MASVRSPVARDAAHRAYHLVRAVFQVAEVVPAGRIARETRPVLVLLEQQRLSHRVGSGSELGYDRVVGVPDARDRIQRRRALGR